MYDQPLRFKVLLLLAFTFGMSILADAKVNSNSLHNFSSHLPKVISGLSFYHNNINEPRVPLSSVVLKEGVLPVIPKYPFIMEMELYTYQKIGIHQIGDTCSSQGCKIKNNTKNVHINLYQYKGTGVENCSNSHYPSAMNGALWNSIIQKEKP